MARLTHAAGPPARRFDLVVVGGGITGACVALEAVRRGLATLLLEAEDFGGGTSWSSLRILHGGLRYLQSADLARFRASVRDRRWFQTAFPQLAVPQPVLLPLRGEGLRRKTVLRAALAANDLLSFRRNAGLSAATRLRGGSVLDRRATLAAVPLSGPEGVQGGALWWDARAHPPQRLLMEIVLRAVAAGGEAWSRAPVLGVRRTQGALVVEIGSRHGRLGIGPDGFAGDRTGGGPRDAGPDDLPGSVLADRVAVCVGPEAPAIEGVVAELPPDAPPAGLAFNVVLRRAFPSPYGVALDPPDGGHTLFAYPLGEWTLAGTAHEPATHGAIGCPSDAAVRRLVARLASTLDGFDVGPGDVARVLAGALPCTGEGSAEQASRAALLPVADLDDRALVVVGIKYTTAPGLASDVIDSLAPGSAARPAPGPWPVRRVPDAWGFLDLSARDPEAARELVRGLTAEGAHGVDDVVLRRTDWGLDPRVGEQVAARIASLGGMAP